MILRRISTKTMKGCKGLMDRNRAEIAFSDFFCDQRSD